MLVEFMHVNIFLLSNFDYSENTLTTKPYHFDLKSLSTKICVRVRFLPHNKYEIVHNFYPIIRRMFP